MKTYNLIESTENLIDNINGLGSVPYNQEVDYMGLRVKMRPSMFLKLAAPAENYHSLEHIEQYIENGGKIGSPFLMIDIPDEWFVDDIKYKYSTASVRGHEGRNRMRAIQNIYGDVPIETHLFFRGGIRARNLTDNIKHELKKWMVSEINKDFVSGPTYESDSSPINESISNTVYHYTRMPMALSILSNNRFELVPDLGSDSESKLRAGKDNIYSISVTRNKRSEYHYPISEYQTGAVIFVIDGTKLGYTHRGRPVNYWAGSTIGKREYEDRIYSKKPIITNASKYITSIHCFVSNELRLNASDRHSSVDNEIRNARKLKIIASRLGINAFFYIDPQAMSDLDTSKAIKLSSLETKNSSATTNQNNNSRIKPNNHFAKYIELFTKSDPSQLSKAARQLLFNGILGWHKSDAITSLRADIHNSRRGTNEQKYNLYKFLSHMQKNKLSSVEEYIEFIANKFKDHK